MTCAENQKTAQAAVDQLPAPVLALLLRLSEDTPAECGGPYDGKDHHGDHPDILFFHGNLPLIEAKDIFL